MTSYEIFSTLKNFDDDVLQIEGVFLFDTSFPGVPIELYYLCPGYEYVNFEYSDIEDAPRSINARKYSNPITFSVYLINQKFYNTYFTGIDTPYIFDNTKMDHMYMLMLFPIYYSSFNRDITNEYKIWDRYNFVEFQKHLGVRNYVHTR